MASSSSSSPASWQCRYDVFLSFRGEDTRQNFTSHLYAALCRKAIETFIDKELRRGEEISPALLEAIENSKAAVIIFSKNYASSPWCLDELVKIVQCHELHGQRVIPVFYHVNPSDVLEQTGVFEEAFAEHEISFKEKSLRWKAAMTKAANLAGWDSQVVRPESRLVDDIVKDILSKLKEASASGLEEQVGLDSRIDQVKGLLSIGGLDGTEAIEGIFLDMSKITEAHLNPNAFARMSNLKFLKFYMPNCGIFEEDNHNKLQLSEGLKSLPNELRYLYWHGYPLKSFPVNFHPMNLVELILPYSNLKRLWKTSMDLGKLKKIDLSHSQHLMEFPCPSQAPNLVGIILTGCTSLPKKVPPSISRFSKLTSINLMDCKNIRSFPSTVDLEFLDTVVLAGCSKLARFPEFSRSIRHINLDRAAIKEVPLSVGCLDRLCELHVTNCTKLESLPSSICKLKSLGIINLSGCSKLKKFPEIFENMDDLWELVLDGTAIEVLPSSIEHLKRLSSLHLNVCKNLAGLPESLWNLTELYDLHLSGCSKLEKLPRNLKNLKHLGELKAGRCDRLLIPADLTSLSSLRSLDLSCNKFERMPTAINQLLELTFLDISQCERLKSLPELPPHLKVIKAFDCISLETISSLTELCPVEFKNFFSNSNFMFTNCLKLDQNALNDIVSHAQQKLRIFSMGAECYNELNLERPSVRICYAGSEIPEWFPFQSVGSSITVHLPPCGQNGRFLGFASCNVVEFQNSHCGSGFSCQFEAQFHTKNDSGRSSLPRMFSSFYIPMGDLEECRSVRSEHVLLWYEGKFFDFDWCTKIGLDLGEHWYNEATLEFRATLPRCYCNIECCKVKKCGVLLLYAEEEVTTSTD
ncbi:unnamed protein product [Dovyalis caffra]|uniref:TIR domain-containing protein n=1 Tax=Dovyalis caffra TaxID=77055 RepID=A0AAV1QTC9_9ROSI|nr:unnamed protein product [Dovyalis caffra]